MKRNILVVGAAAALSVATLVGVAGTASASTTSPTQNNSYVAQPTGVYSTTSKLSPTYGSLNAGKAVEAKCFIVEDEETDGSTFWFRIASDEMNGWVPRAALGGVPNLPGCYA